MLQSKLFTKTKKEFPADEISRNAELLLRAGFIHKEMSGVYTFLPLGLKVLNKIIEIIRQEMNKISGQEILMTTLQDLELWKKTKRDPSNTEMDIWLTTKLKSGTEVGLAFTHEETITNIMTQFVKSYKDLPSLIYQFQTKFRNEVRAKSGIMRSREFIMKDLYSFARNEIEHQEIYQQVSQAYENIFARVGLGSLTYKTFASGGVFAKYSHEFQTLTEAGEDEIYLDLEKKIAVNQEVYTAEVLKDLNLQDSDLLKKKSVEVGNIFSLGIRFSEALNLKYKDQEGRDQFVIMGSYGIGPARLMGTIVETLSDQKGMIWPEAISPFSLHLISLAKNENDNSFLKAKEIYEKLIKNNVEVLFDDRLEKSVGEKLSDADLIGLPIRAIISEKSLLAGGIEIKERKSQENLGEIISLDQFLHMYLKEC